MDFLRHLFDTTGFPNLARYGQSWEPVLITIFVVSKGIAACTYGIFVYVFAAFSLAWRQGRIIREAAEVHVPRVGVAFLITCGAQLLWQAITIVAFWWPANRFIGLYTLLASLIGLVVALKSLYALTACTQRPGRPKP